MSQVRPLARDTHPEIEKIQLDFYRGLPAWKKLERVEDGNRTTRLFALAGLRARHPEASDAEIQRRLMDLLLGPETARRAFGPLIEAVDGSADGDS